MIRINVIHVYERHLKGKTFDSLFEFYFHNNIVRKIRKICNQFYSRIILISKKKNIYIFSNEPRVYSSNLCEMIEFAKKIPDKLIYHQKRNNQREKSRSRR